MDLSTSPQIQPGVVPPGQPWGPELIKAAIRERGLSLAELSRQRGYARGAVRRALRAPWPAIEDVIADFIGVPAAEIWPDRYGPSGASTQLIERHYRRGAVGRHRQRGPGE